ncbi:hypothetical protein [Rhodococcus qingshengii]|uniref:hypothetical protein n=1 Tax=Rhodococcus qingshengii TaxID=334542 RepID=UPI00287FA9C6|nr:hypothetical protein [Rhodococcus qingshengii]
MTRTNNAAKNAARERQRKSGGNYTSALRHVKRVPAHDEDRDLVVPFAAVDGWFSKAGSNVRGQCIAIGGGMYSSGLILSGGEARDGALGISLLTALAARYSPQRVNFMAWGLDVERLRNAGLTDYLTDSPRDSLSEFLEAGAVEDKTRGKMFDDLPVDFHTGSREKVGADGPGMAHLVIVVRVDLAYGSRPSADDIAALNSLRGRASHGLTVVVDVISGDKSASDALDTVKHSLGLERDRTWVLQARLDEMPCGRDIEPGEGRNRDRLLARAHSELNRLIGLDEPKKQVQMLRQRLLLEAEYVKRAMPLTERPRHLLFEGPRGSGKATMAQVVADLYAGLGVLRTPLLSTVSGWSSIGSIDGAAGGVAFIDTSQLSKFSVIEMMNDLVQHDLGEVMLIVAGNGRLLERAIDAVDGASRMFPTTIRFEPYQPSEIAELATMVAGEADQKLTPDAGTAIADYLGMVRSGTQKPELNDLAGNARVARAIVEGAETHRGLRLPTDLSELTDDELRTLTAEDVTLALRQLFREARV